MLLSENKQLQTMYKNIYLCINAMCNTLHSSQYLNILIDFTPKLIVIKQVFHEHKVPEVVLYIFLALYFSYVKKSLLLHFLHDFQEKDR